jgi:ribosomal protein S12 methylthiotransferase
MARLLPSPPKVGMVSLGCPKNLVDSERILTKLRSDGYAMSPDYAGADVVLVNTCGFLDSAKEESLEAIGEAMAENGRVIVTGCMGKEAERSARASPTCSPSPALTNMKKWSARCTRRRRCRPRRS